jgi:hypothetical protein
MSQKYDDRAKLLIENNIREGEKLRWRGQPVYSPIYYFEEIRIILFGAVSLVWALYYGIDQLSIERFTQSNDILTPLVITGFVFIMPLILGIACLLAPLLQYFMFRKTYYAITDQRVFVLLPFSHDEVIPLEKKDMNALEKVLSFDGTAKFILKVHNDNGPKDGLEGEMTYFQEYSAYEDVLYGIKDVKDVGMLIGNIHHPSF